MTECCGYIVVGLVEKEVLQILSVEYGTEDYDRYSEDECEWIETNVGEDFDIFKCYESDDEPVIGMCVDGSGSYSKHFLNLDEFMKEFVEAVDVFREKIGEPKVWTVSEID